MKGIGPTVVTDFQRSMILEGSAECLMRGVYKCPALLKTSLGTHLTLGQFTFFSTAQSMCLLKVCFKLLKSAFVSNMF